LSNVYTKAEPIITGWAEVRPGLVLAGVEDLTSRRWHGQTGNFVQQALQGRPNSGATIFVSHTPWEVETAARSGAGLMLSGHTHEGQIWPFGYAVGFTHPFLTAQYEVMSRLRKNNAHSFLTEIACVETFYRQSNSTRIRWAQQSVYGSTLSD
jgi:predicted MPP superfamily phosphohydrolase